jgi:hypothetical protein
MGIIFRLPFYLLGVFLWLLAGGMISLVNLLTLPVFGVASAIMLSIFKTSTKDILSFGILRRGFGNLNNFLQYGL